MISLILWYGILMMLNRGFFYKFCWLLLFAASLITARIVHAQEVPLVISADEFSEGYTGQVNVSSSGVLVGLSIGSKPVWSIEEVLVRLPQNTARRLCLRTSSLDGRFWSNNPYSLPEQMTEVRLGPITKRYAKVLKAMPNDNLAFKVAIPASKDCNDLTSAQYFPVIGEGETKLIVHINSGDRRVVTRLSRAGKAVSKNIECLPIENSARVAADRICHITLPEEAGQVDLQLALIGMTGTAERISFNIYVPAGDPKL